MKKLFASAEEAKDFFISELARSGKTDITAYFTKKEESQASQAFYFDVTYRWNPDSRVRTVNAVKIVIFNKQSGKFEFAG